MPRGSGGESKGAAAARARAAEAEAQFYRHVRLVCGSQAVPTWWSVPIENNYRVALAGYANEQEYLRQSRAPAIDRWPDSGLIKKLTRRDGCFYYFGNERECPDVEPAVAEAFTKEARPIRWRAQGPRAGGASSLGVSQSLPAVRAGVRSATARPRGQPPQPRRPAAGSRPSPAAAGRARAPRSTGNSR